MKKISEIRHNYRVSGDYVEVDRHNSLYRNSTWCKIHYTVNGVPYIWFGGHTYYLEVE